MKTEFLKNYGRIVPGFQNERADINPLYKKFKKHLNAGRRQLVIFSFDLIGLSINIDGVYEIEYLDTFFEWTKKLRIDFNKHNAIDIGAYIGNHSLFFSDYFNTVYSFEPNKNAYDILLLNAKLSDNNIYCYNYGCSSQSETAYLETTDNSNLGASKIVFKNSNKNLQKVSIKRIDEFDFKKIKLIKIDAEGLEQEVLKGSINLIKKYYPFILFEQTKNNHSTIIEYLKNIGYNNFAHIEESLDFIDALFNFPLSLKRLIKNTHDLLFGKSFKLILNGKIYNKFYNLIIAIPDWALQK